MWDVSVGLKYLMNTLIEHFQNAPFRKKEKQVQISATFELKITSLVVVYCQITICDFKCDQDRHFTYHVWLCLPSTHAIKQLLCRFNTHMHCTEAWSFPAADAGRGWCLWTWGLRWMKSGLHIVFSFDGQTKYTYIKTLRLPLDSLHSPLVMHSSHIRRGIPK